jgi:DNA polymerase-3 subunit delta
MYQQEFEKLLKEELPNIVLLYGENSFFLDHYRKLYIDRLNAKEEMLEQLYDTYNFEQARNYLSQGSLFGGTNLFILRSNKKVPKKELDQLIESTKRNPSNYFLYLYEGSSRDAKSLVSSFGKKNSAISVRFFEANYKLANEFARGIVQELGLNISPYALNYLLSTLNFNLALIQKELEKLAILNEPIEVAHIDSLVYSTAPLAVEKAIISLFKKEDITTTINHLIELGEDIFALLRAIERFLQQLFLFNAYIRLNGAPNSKEILGYQLPKFVENERAALANRIKPATLLKIYQILLESELLIKTSPASSKESLFYATLIKIREVL